MLDSSYKPKIYRSATNYAGNNGLLDIFEIA